MIRIGIVGFGFMGRMHYRCWNALPGVKIAAICEGNPEALKVAAGGNVAGAAETIDLTGVATFTKYDEFLASGLVDAVSITLPTFLHADFSCKALEKGLHVLCEKPMALNLAECDRMVAAAQSSGKVLQIGHCIRFWPEYVKAREIVRNGEYGHVVAATFQRLGSLPSWNPANWFADERRSGGMLLDLHIHDADFVQHLFGLPSAVFCAGDPTRLHTHTSYLFEDGPAVAAEGSWRMAPSFGFEMSFNIVLERATLVFDSTRTPSFRICPKDGTPFTPEVASGDGYSRQIEHFARRVNGEHVEDILTLEQSRDSVRMVLAEKESAQRLEPVKL
jgi:predicted dehydrogenase